MQAQDLDPQWFYTMQLVAAGESNYISNLAKTKGSKNG